jgi:hypothetical protein
MIAVAVLDRQVDSRKEATQNPNSSQNGLTPSTLLTRAITANMLDERMLYALSACCLSVRHHPLLAS